MPPQREVVLRQGISRNITAPATIMKTRQEIHKVSEMDLRNPAHEIFFLARHRIRAMAQLAAAASVAVTTPVKRAYMMIPKRIKISIRSGIALILSSHVLFGPFGPQSGWRQQDIEYGRRN